MMLRRYDRTRTADKNLRGRFRAAPFLCHNEQNRATKIDENDVDFVRRHLL